MPALPLGTPGSSLAQQLQIWGFHSGLGAGVWEEGLRMSSSGAPHSPEQASEALPHIHSGTRLPTCLPAGPWQFPSYGGLLAPWAARLEPHSQSRLPEDKAAFQVSGEQALRRGG